MTPAFAVFEHQLKTCGSRSPESQVLHKQEFAPRTSLNRFE